MTNPNPVAPKTDTPATKIPEWKDQCEWCDGSGSVDSGGTTPWGAPLDVKCGYCQGTGLRYPAYRIAHLESALAAERASLTAMERNRDEAERERDAFFAALQLSEKCFNAERASRKLCPECDFPYVPISNGPTAYVCAFCNLLKDNERLDGELKAERASRVQADTDGWVNAKDRLPEGPRDVLILLGNAIVERGYWYRMDTPIDGWYFRGSRVDNVTHWQPLPSYPAKPSVSPEQEKP